MKTIVVLAMHGAPPSDFPRGDMIELMGLHERLKSIPVADPLLAQRYSILETRMRTWPRSAANDPFFTASEEMAVCLAERLGMDVIVGFNEFSAPSIPQALEMAVQRGAELVVVVTPMLTRGGEHVEREIPAEIRQAQKRFPQVTIRYAWPFESCTVSDLLAAQVERAMQEPH